MALVPDISGVCSIEGTLEMTSKPTKIESTKMNRTRISTLISLVEFQFSIVEVWFWRSLAPEPEAGRAGSPMRAANVAKLATGSRRRARSDAPYLPVHGQEK